MSEVPLYGREKGGWPSARLGFRVSLFVSGVRLQSLGFGVEGGGAEGVTASVRRFPVLRLVFPSRLAP